MFWILFDPILFLFDLTLFCFIGLVFYFHFIFLFYFILINFVGSNFSFTSLYVIILFYFIVYRTGRNSFLSVGIMKHQTYKDQLIRIVAGTLLI